MSELSAADEAAPLCIYIKSEPADDEPPVSDDERRQLAAVQTQTSTIVTTEPHRGTDNLQLTHRNRVNRKKRNDSPAINSSSTRSGGKHKKPKKDRCKKKKRSNAKIKNIIQEAPKKKQPVQCDICHKWFASKKRYTVHISVHTGAKPFECHCGKNFRLKGALRVHMKIHERENGESNKLYICSTCGKTFMLSCHLRQHSRVHSDDKPYVCDMCGRGFRSKQHLLDHINTHSRVKPYMCSQCGSCFKRAAYLRGHLLKSCNPEGVPRYRKPRGPPKNASTVTSSDKPYACEQCSRTYNHVKNLKRHILSDHVGIKPHKCKECGKSFASKTELSIHEKSHIDDRPFPCPLCGFAFHQKPHLKRHLQKCKGVRPFRCNICHVNFADVYTLDAHRESHAEEVKVDVAKTEPEVAKAELEDTARSLYETTPFEDVTCKYSDSEPENDISVAESMQEIVSNDSISVENEVDTEAKSEDTSLKAVREIKTECSEKIDIKSRILIKHVDKNKPFSCDQCGKTFRLIAYLNKHILTHTNMRHIKPHACDQCGKCFPTPGELRSHVRTHTGERPYACKICAKTFGHRASVKSHMRTHDVDDTTGGRARPFKCTQCDKSFTEKITLDLHRVTHTGERPYQCKDCGKSFAWPGNLRSHSVVHSGVKSFVCGECGKSFLRKSTLRLHSLTHTGERPYVCDQCGKSFLCASSLKTHIKTHAEYRPFGCEQCGKRFALPSGLKDHRKTHLRIKKAKSNSESIFSFAGSSKFM